MQKHLECKVYGSVHGVGFRETTASSAKDLGLVGYVQNEPYGVHVVAEGDESVLREFFEKLHVGSAYSRVERIEEKWSEAAGAFKDFRIRYRNFLDRL